MGRIDRLMCHRLAFFLLLSLSSAAFASNAALQGQSAPGKLIRYFALSGETFRLRLAGEQFFVQRWPTEGSLAEWAAPAAGAEGEIGDVTVLDDDDIEVQLSSPERLQIWKVNVEEAASVIRPRLIWAGTLGSSEAGWAIHRVQDDIHVATNGSAMAAIERGLVRTLDARLYSTDGAARHRYYAAATGHGLSVWSVENGQMRFDSARDYNVNGVQVAAMNDGGWLLLTTRDGAVQLVAVDRSLMPRWLLPLPGGIAWELHDVAYGVVVAANDEANAWLVAGGKTQRFEWTKTSPAAEVVASDAANFVRLTDGITVGEPHAIELVAMQAVTGMWVGSKWLIVPPRVRQRAIVIAAVILLLIGSGIIRWFARRVRPPRSGISTS
jgi:hypothetical protein